MHPNDKNEMSVNIIQQNRAYRIYVLSQLFCFSKDQSTRSFNK